MKRSVAEQKIYLEARNEVLFGQMKVLCVEGFGVREYQAMEDRVGDELKQKHLRPPEEELKQGVVQEEVDDPKKK